MPRVRQFKLRNGAGQEFDMMRYDAFLYEPKGLGWGIKAETVPVGNSYHVTDETVNQPSPSGTMNFAGYAQYEEFLHFVQSGGLVLCYMPINTWRYLRVYVVIDKDEISHENNRLLCPVTFQGVSQWYEATLILNAQAEAVDEDAKLYNADYSDQYAYRYYYEDVTAGGVAVHNGALPSYWKATIYGSTTNPEWRLYVNDVLTKSGKITATIATGHSLVVNAVPSEFSIIEYDANGDLYLDQYGNSVWTTERFFELPAGDSMVLFTDDTQDTPKAQIEVYRRV